MKSIVVIFGLFLAQHSLACGPDSATCPGTLVYKGATYSRGATVLGYNPYRRTVTVQSVNTGNKFEENVAELYVTSGCVGKVCAGTTVFKGQNYSQGARVLAVNPYNQQVTVQSVNSGNLFAEVAQDLDLTTGCRDNVCVGDMIYKGSTYSRGATVVAIKQMVRNVVVRSINSGNLFVENPRELSVTVAAPRYQEPLPPQYRQYPRYEEPRGPGHGGPRFPPPSAPRRHRH